MKLSSVARCIDQPLVIHSLQQKMPAILIGAGTAYGLLDTFKSTKNKKKENRNVHALKNAIIISSTIAASLVGTRGLKIKGKTIIPALMPRTSLFGIVKKQTKAVSEFLSETGTKDEKLLAVLNKARHKPLMPKEVESVMIELPDSPSKTKLLSAILPDKENLDAKGIFSEIGRLSVLGAVPVVGGVLGGLAADKITGTQTKHSASNKIKEGFYQYFANIFLCNVGACAALFTAERLQAAKVIKPLTPMKKLAVIMSGITATGIIGGSYIANKLSQKIIDPLFCKGDKNFKKRGVYDERKPELTDIALHVDDIATAGVLSGFKWIEPALPFMYFVSGYRAGIGYRNAPCAKTD